MKTLQSLVTTQDALKLSDEAPVYFVTRQNIEKLLSERADINCDLEKNRGKK